MPSFQIIHDPFGYLIVKRETLISNGDILNSGFVTN